MRSGYTKAWRRELLSDVWKMHPLYHRVFYYLRHKANWENKLLPTRQVPKMGMWLSPGMLISSYELIAEGVSYYEDGVLKVPNKKTIKVILDWLEEYQMIERISNAKGTVIYITNWDTYQSNDDIKVTPDGLQKKRQTDTKKKYKEVKEVKEVTSLAPDSEKIDFDLPEWIDRELWGAWMEVRKKKRVPTTEHAARLNIQKLNLWRVAGQDPNAIIRQSIENGYQGLFELKAQFSGRTASSHGKVDSSKW